MEALTLSMAFWRLSDADLSFDASLEPFAFSAAFKAVWRFVRGLSSSVFPFEEATSFDADFMRSSRTSLASETALSPRPLSIRATSEAMSDEMDEALSTVRELADMADLRAAVPPAGQASTDGSRPEARAESFPMSFLTSGPSVGETL